MADPSLCERCGRCCYSKVIVGGQVVSSPFPCPHLDEDTRLCTIYDHRFGRNPQCLTVEMGIRLRLFPADCPYVRDIPGYVAPRARMTAEEIESYTEDILESHDAIRDGAESP